MLSTVRGPFTATQPLPSWGISIARRGADLYHVGIGTGGSLIIFKNAISSTIATGVSEIPTIGIAQDGTIHIAGNSYYYTSSTPEEITQWDAGTSPGYSVSFFNYDSGKLGMVYVTGSGFSISFNGIGEVGSLDHSGLQAINARIQECPNGELRGQFVWDPLSLGGYRSNPGHILVKHVPLADRDLAIDSNLYGVVLSMTGCDDQGNPFTAVYHFSKGYLVESEPG